MHGGIDIPGVELLDELGRGAHGAVYRARRGADCYAVKVALAASDPSAFVRFQREAIALARAKHPGLPRVLDVAKSGAPYLVMELVEGETLAARLSRGALSEEETRSLGLQLADVLAHIHRLGLVHRDVKPRNIIFDEKSGRARIVDFGIAIGTASTNFAAAEGTVPYAAPEQLRGLGVDGRADLYSLGCVLYECLCGTPPLGPLSLSRLGKADPLSDEAKLERSGISSSLIRVIASLTSAAPKDRFADASEALEALRSAPAAESTGRRPFFRSSAGTLVGRERELAFLRRAWLEAQGGSQRALVVEGPIGSGKTALLQAFCDQVRAEAGVAIYVACASYDPIPFSVVRRVFDALLEHVGEAKFRQATEGFESLLAVISPALSRIFPYAPAVPDSDDAHHVILESAAKSLSRLLEIEPGVVLCLDDCQWIDAGSAAIARKLLGTGGTSLLMLGQRFGEFDAAAIELETTATDEIAKLTLSALTEQAIGSLVVAYLGTDKIPADVVSRVAALSDPTPLGALEALRTLLDERALLPDWNGWSLQPEVAEGVRLPDSVVDMLRARIAGLDPIVPDVLVGAAVVGMDFDIAALHEITGASQEEVSRAVREACRAALVAGGAVTYRFVHQAVRDALLAACTEGKLRDLSGRAAEALDRKVSGDPAWKGSEVVYRLADLYWRSEWQYTTERAIEVIEQAARKAFEAYDNRQALHFLERAAEIRHATNRRPGAQTLHLNGEILVRLGSLAAGKALLEEAFRLSSDALQRATILSRIAWVCEWELDSVEAWDRLRRAFVEVGAAFPSTSATSFAISGKVWLQQAFRRVRPIPEEDTGARERQKILCALYYRTFRLGMLSANVPQTIQAAVLGLAAAQALGMSAALSRAYIAYSFVLTALGQHERGRSYLKQAEDVARATGNPVAVAHSMQARSVIACWEGKVAEGLEAGARCLLEHGHWQDFSEHCHLAYNQCVLESVRGRGYEELVWVEHVLRQVELNKEAYGLWEYIVLGARALLAHLGRAHEVDKTLKRLSEVAVKIPRESAYYVVSFGPRVRALTETGELGAAFEALETEFRLGRHDPRRVHLAVSEYYVHVAHARLHACLRAQPSARKRHLRELEHAAGELRLAARIPLVKAHSLVVDAYVALFSGEDEKAGRLFAEADALAIEEESPWVRYAVARGRAHLFKGRKHADVVLGEARRAEQIARENGAVHRLRWIREEFGLSQTSAVFALPSPNQSSEVSRPSSVTSSATSRQLKRSTVRLGVRRAQDKALDFDARRTLFLEEVFVAIRASEIHLFSRQPGGRFAWELGRNVEGEALSAPDVLSFVADVAARGLSALIDDTESLRSRIGVPLLNQGEVRSVVYAEAPGCGVFDPEDCQLVTDAAEILLNGNAATRTGDKRQTDRLTHNHRSASEFATALAEHFEALAGDDPPSQTTLLSRVTTISRLLQEARRLERHDPTLVNLNDVVTRAGQRARSLLGPRLELLTALESTLHPAFIDPHHLELVLLHSMLGAHRCLHGKVVLVLETANVSIDQPFNHDLLPLRSGPHVMVTLSAVLEEAEPTTLRPDSVRAVRFGELAEQMCTEMACANDGTLSLSVDNPTVANLRLFFPCASPTTSTFERESARIGSETLLVVDSDARLRQELAAELKKLGYRVLLAADVQGAATMAEIHGGHVDLSLIEIDVERGVERFPEPSARVSLYSSQLPWNALRAIGVGVPKSHFLQKPYSVEALVERIRGVLSERTPGQERRALLSS